MRIVSAILALVLSLSVLHASAASTPVIPGGTSVLVLAANCPTGWTDAGTLTGSITPTTTTFAVRITVDSVASDDLFRRCIANGGVVPSGTIVAMASCPSGWTDVWALSQWVKPAATQVSVVLSASMRQCSSDGSAHSFGATMLMSTCPAGWLDNGVVTAYVKPASIVYPVTYSSSFSSCTAVNSSTTSVALSVSAWSVSLETPSSISFPSIATSNAPQNADMSAWNFIVEDLKWASAGYYATISVSDLASWSNTISKANVFANVSGAAVSRISGSANPAVTVPSSVGTIWAGYVPLSSAITLFGRSSGGWLLGKYFASVSLRIAVPAYTPAGNYSGTVTFTLIEN